MRKTLIFILVFLFLISFVYAIPPTRFSEGDNTLEVKYAHEDTLKQNQNFDFHFHVFNKSDGRFMTENISCFFHLYNQSGNHIVQLNDSTSSNFDYEFNVGGANFSTVGFYSYVTQCNDTKTGEGGFVSVGFEVTTSGGTEQQGKSGMLIAIAMMLIVMTLIFGYWTMKMENPVYMVASGLLTFMMIVVNMWFSFQFVEIIAGSETDLISNLTTMYKITVTIFQFVLFGAAIYLLWFVGKIIGNWRHIKRRWRMGNRKMKYRF